MHETSHCAAANNYSGSDDPVDQAQITHHNTIML